jgi:hypothetical protein
MFGLEDKKNKEDFLFDIEKIWLEPKKLEEFKNQIVEKTDRIKKILREGNKQADYDTIGALLYGYVALLNTAGRMKQNRDKK